MSYCPKCGKQVKEVENFCRACGYNLKDTQSEQPQLEAKGQPSKCAIHSTRDSIGVCANCGKTVCDLCRTVSGDKLLCPSCIRKTTRKPIDKIAIPNKESIAKETPSQESVVKGSKHEVGAQVNERGKEEIPRGWNWGAFFLTWIWGVCNNVWISLLCFVPLVGLVMCFILGAYGSKWAWKNKRWDSVEHFKRVQRKWAWWGFGIWVGCFIILPILSGVVVMVVGGSFGVAKEQAYNSIKPQIQNAVTAYTISHNGYLPPHEGTVNITAWGGTNIPGCLIIDICQIVGVGELLRQVPDGCYGVEGEANTNFYSEECENPSNGHYIWVVGGNGNVYSICEENKDGTYSATDRVDGFHQDIWP